MFGWNSLAIREAKADNPARAEAANAIHSGTISSNDARLELLRYQRDRLRGLGNALSHAPSSSILAAGFNAQYSPNTGSSGHIIPGLTHMSTLTPDFTPLPPGATLYRDRQDLSNQGSNYINPSSSSLLRLGAFGKSAFRNGLQMAASSAAQAVTRYGVHTLAQAAPTALRQHIMSKIVGDAPIPLVANGMYMSKLVGDAPISAEVPIDSPAAAKMDSAIAANRLANSMGPLDARLLATFQTNTNSYNFTGREYFLLLTMMAQAQDEIDTVYADQRVKLACRIAGIAAWPLGKLGRTDDLPVPQPTIRIEGTVTGDAPPLAISAAFAQIADMENVQLLSSMGSFARINVSNFNADYMTGLWNCVKSAVESRSGYSLTLPLLRLHLLESTFFPVPGTETAELLTGYAVSWPRQANQRTTDPFDPWTKAAVDWKERYAIFPYSYGHNMRSYVPNNNPAWSHRNSGMRQELYICMVGWDEFVKHVNGNEEHEWHSLFCRSSWGVECAVVFCHSTEAEQTEALALRILAHMEGPAISLPMACETYEWLDKKGWSFLQHLTATTPVANLIYSPGPARQVLLVNCSMKHAANPVAHLPRCTVLRGAEEDTLVDDVVISAKLCPPWGWEDTDAGISIAPWDIPATPAPARWTPRDLLLSYYFTPDLLTEPLSQTRRHFESSYGAATWHIEAAVLASSVTALHGQPPAWTRARPHYPTDRDTWIGSACYAPDELPETFRFAKATKDILAARAQICTDATGHFPHFTPMDPTTFGDSLGADRSEWCPPTPLYQVGADNTLIRFCLYFGLLDVGEESIAHPPSLNPIASSLSRRECNVMMATYADYLHQVANITLPEKCGAMRIPYAIDSHVEGQVPSHFEKQLTTPLLRWINGFAQYGGIQFNTYNNSRQASATNAYTILFGGVIAADTLIGFARVSTYSVQAYEPSVAITDPVIDVRELARTCDGSTPVGNRYRDWGNEWVFVDSWSSFNCQVHSHQSEMTIRKFTMTQIPGSQRTNPYIYVGLTRDQTLKRLGFRMSAPDTNSQFIVALSKWNQGFLRYNDVPFGVVPISHLIPSFDLLRASPVSLAIATSAGIRDMYDGPSSGRFTVLLLPRIAEAFIQADVPPIDGLGMLFRPL